VGWAEYSVGALVGGIMAAQGDAHVGSIIAGADQWSAGEGTGNRSADIVFVFIFIFGFRFEYG
jgi:hypothetical protein